MTRPKSLAAHHHLMSVDINWDTLTGGADGAALAETIRDFVHERFQAIELPKLLRSVTVHSFEFGNIPPEIVLKDIGDPLPDFYETDDDDEAFPENANDEDGHDRAGPHPGNRSYTRRARATDNARRQSELDILDRAGAATGNRGTVPGILGTTSNLGYFHLPLTGGLSGTQTPLAAVAGAHFAGGTQRAPDRRARAESFGSRSSPSTTTPASLQDPSYFDRALPTPDATNESDIPTHHGPGRYPESSPDDLQVIFHVTYAGDVKLSLTADVFLDYPMPSFVGIPLKLRITGFTFNGVGILAYLKKRAHLCFLNPDDAEALVGGDDAVDVLDQAGAAASQDDRPGKVGGLLEDIKIESEMGEMDSGKQVLKNVGKIEKFVLEQVRRIFEDEFVYPSYWTFLV